MTRLTTSYDEYAFGFSWSPDEPLTRTSHALETDAGVWLVDPVDVPTAIARATALGPTAGVIQLLDRHERDCAELASRLGVAHLRLPSVVAEAPFEVVDVLDVPRWHEKALWWPKQRALVVAETIGTNDVYAVGRGGAGIHPFLRALPPGALRGFEPEHLLVGHGPGLHGEQATTAVAGAYADSRRDIPKLALRLAAMAKDAIRSR